MKVKYLATLTLVFSLCSLLFPSGQRTELSKKYDTWLNEEVAYIVSPREKEVFGKLETDRDRDLFIEEFWKQRDPTPGTPLNEFRDEHYRRIEYVNKRFGGGGAARGWRTDRGRTFIILGPPLSVEKYSSADICPIEVWYYLSELRFDRSIFFRLLFFEEFGTGEFKLYNPVADGPKRLVPFPERWRDAQKIVPGEKSGALPGLPPSWTLADRRAYEILITYVTGEVAEASISSFPGFSGPEEAVHSSALLEEIRSSPWKKINADYALEFLAKKTPAEVSYSVHRMDNLSAVSVLQDLSGAFLVNYIIAPETLTFGFFQDQYFAGLRTNLRVSAAGGKAVFQEEKFHPVKLTGSELKAVSESSFELYGSFSLLAPGAYTVELLLENTVSKEFTSIEKKITVSEGGQLRISPLILARSVVQGPGSGSGWAFRVGKTQVNPSLDNIFQEKDRLFLFFQVYGLSPELTEQGSLEYSFSSDGQAIRTERRKVRESENRPGFLEEFPLDKFAAGQYAIKVALLNGKGEELLSEKTRFFISTKPSRGVWIFAQ